MRWSGQVAVLLFILVIPFAVKPQVWEEDDFDFFYGERSFQEVDIGLMPLSSPAAGIGGEVDFRFNTLSKRTEDAAHWKNYYGAAVDLGAATYDDYDFSNYGTRDMSCTWGAVVIESKLFYDDSSAVRPYGGIFFGFGAGGIGLSDTEDEVDEEYENLIGSTMELYQVGLEAGVHIMLNDTLALVIADTTSYSLGSVIGDSFQLVQTTVTVGIAGWREKRK